MIFCKKMIKFLFKCSAIFFHRLLSLCNLIFFTCVGLLSRLSQMMGYNVHGEAFYPDDDIISTIRKEMWKYNQTYSMNTGVSSSEITRNHTTGQSSRVLNQTLTTFSQ